MKTDYMVIGRVRNSENIQRLVDGIEAKGFTCYNFLHKPAVPDNPDLPWEKQMEIPDLIPTFGTIQSIRITLKLIWMVLRTQILSLCCYLLVWLHTWKPVLSLDLVKR